MRYLFLNSRLAAVNTLAGRIGRFIRAAFEETWTSASQLGVFEEYAPPRTFAPRLTVREALVASLAALVRILLGSMIFAISGVAILFTRAEAPNLILRLGVLPEAELFLFTMLIAQASVSAIVKSRWPRVK